MNTTDFSFRPLRLPEDAALLHRWVSTEQACFWGLTGASRQRVQEEYRQLLATKDYRVLLGQRDGQPRFLVELYDPATSPLAEAYHVVPGDVGLHLLVPAPPAAAEPGFTLAAMTAALAHAFTGPGTERVVVEPDLANKPIQALTPGLGSARRARCGSPKRTGRRSTHCSRSAPGPTLNRPPLVPSPGHLRPGHWQQAHHHLLAKAIGEFSMNGCCTRNRCRRAATGLRGTGTATNSRPAATCWSIGRCSWPRCATGFTPIRRGGRTPWTCWTSSRCSPTS
ncbi:GNAT family N-acetyltransferase [Arthrobacter sp. JCM 19049]|uniref:GNAT family N-acetyltransferase n=1 Tax=Arthrobacter sp. JCM 19049 TaxID=1460643 RepID=UPI000ADC6FF4|nr:GNAT family N-acetyltransferase [Arthrobacter sp. JCM 19049]